MYPERRPEYRFDCNKIIVKQVTPDFTKKKKEE